MSDIVIREIGPADDIGALTGLLNRAYAPLVAAGMNFTAATQDAAQTKRRIDLGWCLVAEDRTGRAAGAAGRLVGSLCLARPVDPAAEPWVERAPWLSAPDALHLQQFGIEPAWQRAGLGARLMAAAEARARELGYARIVLDTAEPAAHLRAWYGRLGYRDVGVVQWDGKAYRSVVLAKPIVTDPLRLNLLTFARYEHWATRQLLRHVDALDDEAYRRDAGLFFASIHRTLNHLLVTGSGLWFPRFARGESPRLALDAEIEPDRGRLRERLLEGAAAWLPLVGRLPDERLAGMLEYRRTTGEAARLPFVPTLAHVFNHATHHRGQISAALTALGRPAPVLDLAAMLVHEESLK